MAQEITITVEDLTQEVTLGIPPIGGDMTKVVYDPTNKNADAFDYANFDNTPTTITAQQDSDITSNNKKLSLSSTIGEPIGSDLVLNVISLLQAEYDAGPINPQTIYNITDA